MNIPFPVLMPHMVDSKWFGADAPCDEDAELKKLELENQHRLHCIGLRYMKQVPLGKTDTKPVEEEADTDEEEVIDESDESEESHDEDEEEEPPTTYTPPQNNELEPVHIEDLTDEPDTPDQSGLWPLQ